MAKRLTVLVLIGLAIAGYIHGIIWAGGINQPGNNWSHGNMPWQAFWIDFAPIWAIGVFVFGCLFVEVGGVVAALVGGTVADLMGGYTELPKAPTKAQKLAAKQAEREATIARLERELGLVESAPRPPMPSCSHRDRTRVVTAGARDSEVCNVCGRVFEGEEDIWA